MLNISTWVTHFFFLSFWLSVNYDDSYTNALYRALEDIEMVVSS